MPKKTVSNSLNGTPKRIARARRDQLVLLALAVDTACVVR